MPINNYLVIGVNPANNETTVPLDRVIAVTFAKHMELSSLTPATLVLKKVNGGIIPYTMNYSADIMTARIKPSEPLEPGTQYQLQVVATADGVKSITGDYMTASRNYLFTTSFSIALSPPQSLVAKVDNGFPILEWERPADYDAGAALTYEAMISTSNDPLMTPLWPSVGDVNKVGTNSLNVPKKLSEGNYYAYIRALNGTEKSEWASKQFVVEKEAENPDPPIGGGDGGGDIFSLGVVDRYPKKDGVDITPKEIIILFDGPLDETTVDEQSIYLVEGKDRPLTAIDLMTGYSATNRIVGEAPLVEGNIVRMQVELEDDKEYTVIIRETVKNKSGASVGIVESWSFLTNFTLLYGDADLIRQDLGSMSDTISDRLLYTYMKEASLYVYEIASNTAVFDEALYSNGEAPYYIHQYVRYKTAYDLLLHSQLQSGGGGVVTDVSLGDLKVSKDAEKSGGISGVTTELKKKLTGLMDMIQGHHNRGYAKPSLVIRGESSESYPEYLTRAEFKDLGQ